MVVILDDVSYINIMEYTNNHELNDVIENREHYSYQTKLLIDMYNAGKLPEVENITVKPRYGYVASINYRDGGTRILYGHNSGFNAGSSE